MAAPAGAAPIRYQLKVPNATGQLGSQTFTNAPATFTFVGDDTNVFSGTTVSEIPFLPISYSAIYIGVASVTIIGSDEVPETAVFAPNQIVVSVDHGNIGLGFGFVPGGIGPSGFDVTELLPLYPAGIACHAVFPACNFDTGELGYDLTLAYAQSMAGTVYTNPSATVQPASPYHPDGSAYFLSAVYSCLTPNSFAICTSSPPPIQTDLGAFTIGPISEPTTVGTAGLPLYIGEFTAEATTPHSIRH